MRPKNKEIRLVRSLKVCMGFFFCIPVLLGFMGIPLDILIAVLAIASRRIDALSLRLKVTRPLVAGVVAYIVFLWSDALIIGFMYAPSLLLLAFYSVVVAIEFAAARKYL